MESVKRKIISFWLTHVFLRQIGKRYPDYFKRWMKDLSDDKKARQIMYMRYLDETPYKFEAIAATLNMSPRRVFEKHKKMIDHIISSTQRA